MTLYYQTDVDGLVTRVVSQPDRALPPEGFERAPDGMSRGALKALRKVGDAWEIAPMREPDPPEVVAAAVVAQARAQALHAVTAERDRRIAAGFLFGGRRFDFDPMSKQRITGAATLAGFAMGQGAGAGNLLWHGGVHSFTWIAGDNGLVTMDAPTCFAFGQAAAAHESAHIFAARALKDRPEGVPEDFAADRWWPA